MWLFMGNGKEIENYHLRFRVYGLGMRFLEKMGHKNPEDIVE